MSVSFLSSLERGYSNASIATLQKLARLYDTNVLAFFADEDDSRRMVRARERTVRVPNPGVQMELLAFGKKVMEPHLFRIAPGADSGGSYSHEGEEFIYVFRARSRFGSTRLRTTCWRQETACTLEHPRAPLAESQREGDLALVGQHSGNFLISIRSATPCLSRSWPVSK